MVGAVNVRVIFGAVVVASVLAMGPAVGAPAPRGPLRVVAAPTGRYIGSAAELPALRNDPDYTAVSDREFDMLTPTNVLKWDATEPQRGQFTFAEGDEFVAHAKAAGQRVRGVPLVWHQQLPAWLTSQPFSADELRTIMTDHVDALARHYRGQLYAWDVVNEPIADDGTLRPTLFSQALGESYIAEALRTARAADPTAKLYINDYLVEGVNAKSNGLYALVQRLLADGVPIDGVGLQGHLYLGTVPADLRANMQRFAALGLDVAVTELDVPMSLPADAAKLDQQARDVRAVADACLAVPRCVGLTLWDFTDKYSWIPATFPGAGAATPFDESLHPKPAYDALVAAFVAAGGSGTVPDSDPTPIPTTSSTTSPAASADPPPTPVRATPRYTG
jgi:endo-1,4-beta-xylanase